MTIPTAKWLACTMGAAALGLTLPNCAAAPTGESTATGEAAVLGATTWDSTCSPDQTELNRAFTLGQVAANSRAFSECVAKSMAASTNVGQGLTVGAYSPATGDPSGAGPGTVLTETRSMNPTSFTCSYGSNGNTIPIPESIGISNTSATEFLYLGSALNYLHGKPGPCFLNPNLAGC